MRTRTSLAPLLALLAMACDEGGSLAYYNVEILDTGGDFPVDDGMITVTVKHAGETLECNDGPCTADIRDGEFMGLELPLASWEGMTEIRADIWDEPDRWIGATPPFQPWGEGVDAAAALRVVVGRPETCAELTLDGYVTGDPAALAPPRARAAAVVRRNVVLIAGGEEIDGAADDHVTKLDQLLFDTVPFDPWTDRTEIGAARGLALSEDVSLVVGDRAQFLYELGQASTDPIDLHDGVGFASAVVSLPTGGAVIGGRATRGISWINAQGAADTSRQLAVDRTAPVAARLGDGILVVGGHAAGAASAEWLPLSGSGEPRDLDLPVASGGVLFPSPDGAAALWIGYVEGGVTSSTTALIRCDDGDCTAEPGPVTWDRARADFASVVTAGGTLWLLGGEIDGELTTHVDLVRWQGGAPRIEAGPDLPVENAGAVAFEHTAGVVTLAGGRYRDMAGRFVMCFPSALDL